MKIIHVAPNAPYEEGWSYQENLLPKYQAKLGHQVILVVSTQRHHQSEQGCCSFEDYQSADGFRVIRQPIRLFPLPFLRRTLQHLQVYELFCREKPDVIFHHGLISPSARQAARYKKRVNPHCVILQDNHMDYNIGFTTDCLKGRSHSPHPADPGEGQHRAFRLFDRSVAGAEGGVPGSLCGGQRFCG